MSWAAEEFKDIDLGDQRLNRRAILLMERLAEKLTATIPGACGGWAETQAAYRFLAHEEMDWRDILAPHWACTQARLRHQVVVLCLQTAPIWISTVRPSPLGPLNYEAQRGMFWHPTYAVTPAREPLGMLGCLDVDPRVQGCPRPAWWPPGNCALGRRLRAVGGIGNSMA